jgi:hypothetical protein
MGDVLYCLLIINKPFYEACREVFNPRNAMYISRNNGLFNNAACVQRDSIINANTLLNLGRRLMDTEFNEARIAHIKEVLEANEKREYSYTM